MQSNTQPATGNIAQRSGCYRQRLSRLQDYPAYPVWVTRRDADEATSAGKPHRQQRV